jgi:hypothetical protein
MMPSGRSLLKTHYTVTQFLKIVIVMRKSIGRSMDEFYIVKGKGLLIKCTYHFLLIVIDRMSGIGTL